MPLPRHALHRIAPRPGAADSKAGHLNLGVVVEGCLLLSLHYRNALNVVFVLQFGAPPPQRQHARLHCHRLQAQRMERGGGW